MIKIRILLIPLVLLTAILPFLLKKNSLSTDITVLLPEDPWISSHVDFLRNSQIGSITALSIDADNLKDSPRIAEFAEEFSNMITVEPEVKEVFYRFSSETLTETGAFLFPRSPQILNEDDLSEISKKLESKGIEKLLKDHYENLLRPGGIFQQKMVASDPLNLYKSIIRKIQSIGKDSGFRFVLKDNGLWSEDGKSYLILIYTNVPVTDASKGAQYLEMLENNLKKAISDSGYSYTFISGHRHAIENQRILKRDISITLTVAGIGFFMLFFIFFKDWKAIFVFIIPILGMLGAVGLTWLCFRSPSVIILGLGATVIGIALDYGIHVFVSLKQSQEKEKSIKKLLRPLIFSALTTLGVFWAFFFSGTPGYHQLAFASTMGIAISLLLSLACLPIFLPSGKSQTKNIGTRNLNFSFPQFSKHSAKKVAIVWMVLIIISIIASFYIDFESDIRKMDGSESALKSEKEKFAMTWGENSQAAVIVSSDNIETAMEKHDKIAKFAKKKEIAGYQSLSEIWPSKKTRQKNISNWNSFWNPEKIDYVKCEFRKKGEKYGFSESAFEPFFSKLHDQNSDDDFRQNAGFNILSRKFVNRHKDKVTINALFKDDSNAVNELKKITSEIEGASVISPRYFGDYISSKILDDAYNIAVIAIILVVLLAWSCLKRPADTFKALIPVISAVLSVVPLYALFGWKINAIALVAMIVITGLAIDYGIFAVTAMKNNEPEFSKNAFTALTISMLSTIIGSGALLFASHPALNTVGKVITTGVIAAYLSAILVVPAIASKKS